MDFSKWTFQNGQSKWGNHTKKSVKSKKVAQGQTKTKTSLKNSKSAKKTSKNQQQPGKTMKNCFTNQQLRPKKKR